MSAHKLPDVLDCITCGLCIPTCPTWQATGRESQGPRGRVQLMRALQETRIEPDATVARELQDCLVCRRCESHCPAGVQFGGLMEETRETLVRAGFRPNRRTRTLLRQVLRPAALNRSMELLRLGRKWKLAGRLAPFTAKLPPIPPAAERKPLPDFIGAHSPRQGEVWLLEGCVMPQWYGRVNRAAVELLQRVGFDVRVPRPRLCCGALHAHAGEGEIAREQARAWVRLMRDIGPPDAILTTSAGCGAHMQSFGTLLAAEPLFAEDAREFGEKVMDVTTFLATPHLLDRLLPQLGPCPTCLPLAYDDPLPPLPRPRHPQRTAACSTPSPPPPRRTRTQRSLLWLRRPLQPRTPRPRRRAPRTEIDRPAALRSRHPRHRQPRMPSPLASRPGRVSRAPHRGSPLPIPEPADSGSVTTHWPRGQRPLCRPTCRN
ncbi:MAG: 4Fe-4S dicluster domain-containing protein [Planctomycetota bacterium]